MTRLNSWKGFFLKKTFVKTVRVCYEKKSFPGSSVVEQVAVNHLVGGSNPSQGAISLYPGHITGQTINHIRLVIF